MAKELSVFDIFEFSSIWWLPQAPEDRLPGSITRERGSLRLELFDANSRVTAVLDGGGHPLPYTIPLLHGQLEGGKECTLFRVREANRTTNSKGFDTSVAESDVLFVGEHFASEIDIAFEAFSIEFSYLDSWMESGPIFKTEDIREKGRFAGWSVKLMQQPGLSIDVPSISSSVGFGYSMSQSGDRTSHGLSVTASVTISSSQSRPFEWCLARLRDLQNLLTLLVGKPIHPSKLTGITSQGRSVMIIPYFMGRIEASPSRIASVRVRLADIRPHIERMVQIWFDRPDQLNDVHDLFFGTFYAPDMYVHSKYLSLIQALEAYSRATTPGTYLTAAEYEVIRLALIGAIPPQTSSDLKDSLKNRIKYGNEYSLRKRLTILLRTLEPDTLALVCSNLANYVERVVSTRNYLTHYTSELKAAAWHEEKLATACQSLSVLLTIMLLRDLSLPESLIRTLLLQHRQTAEAIQSSLSVL